MPAVCCCCCFFHCSDCYQDANLKPRETPGLNTQNTERDTEKDESLITVVIQHACSALLNNKISSDSLKIQSLLSQPGLMVRKYGV